MAAPDVELDDDEIGAAFTGKKAGPGPTQNIMEPAPQPTGGGMGFLENPADRAALLQIGLNLMQPIGFGQTVGGHIGQAIGAGGEAASRGEAEDLKRQQAESKLAIADERLRIAQQNADTRERRGVGRAVKGLSAYQEYRASRDEKKDAEKEAKEAKKEELAQAQRIADQVENLKYNNPNHPNVRKYEDKTVDEIVEMRRGGGTAPAAAGGAAPRQAADGNFYVPDPNRPGKYLKVNP